MPINYLISRVLLQTESDLTPNSGYIIVSVMSSVINFLKSNHYMSWVCNSEERYLLTMLKTWHLILSIAKGKNSNYCNLPHKTLPNICCWSYYMSAISWTYLALLSKNTFFNLFVKQLLLNNSLFEVINHLGPACRHGARHYKSHLIFIHSK